MIISCCGMECEKCKEYPQRCPGCDKIAGKPLWALELEDSQCPFYLCCVSNKKLSCCKECREPICHVKEELDGGQ